ncbi:hypothetical protein BX616_000809, partial [Lobosporangium transversale]
MVILIDAYMDHLGNVLDMLVQERTVDPISPSFDSPSSATPPFEFIDTEASPIIQKVDAALQRVVQKMFMLEYKLAHHRSECNISLTTKNSHHCYTQPAVTPPILMPGDSLSPPIFVPNTSQWSTRSSTWGFLDQAVDHSTPTPRVLPSSPCSPQEKHLPLSSVQTLSEFVTHSANNQISKSNKSANNEHNKPGQSMDHVVSSSSLLSFTSSPSSLHDHTSHTEPSTAISVSTPTSSITSLPASNIGSSSTDATASLGSFLLVDLASSMPSSPTESFRSAYSTIPFDNSGILSREAILQTTNQHDRFKLAGTIPAPAMTSHESPCAACISKCALIAASVVRGDLRDRIICENEACNNSALTISINQMVSKLSTFTEEVIQVAAQGVKGKLGVQARLEDQQGIWNEFVSHLNTMTVGYSEQVRDIASVCTAVAHGDLSQKITVSVKGETLVLKNTINTMVDQLRSFSSEVTRVAHEVGTEGRLGGQAHVKGVDGTWKELTDNVNTMAANLTAQVRDIADVTQAVAKGDLSKKISVEVKGEMMDLKNTINTMVDQLQQFATEVSRVSLEVGTEGKLGGQAVVKDVSGTWKELTDNVNLMASNLTGQMRDIATVCKAVACGDLTKKVSVPVQGEILELKETMNTMVDQLRTFAAEVTRVAREVGTEGKLGGQAEVEGVDGTWKELTDNVNTMAANLTAQVRDIASVSKAVAKGDLSKKISVEVEGEMMDLKHTINIMVDQLQEFATEVSRVSLEVGTEGKLGGQAVVKDVSGTWKELTDNVNTMASNLTTQVRSIAE